MSGSATRPRTSIEPSGRRADAGDSPLWPLGAGGFAEVGGAIYIAFPRNPGNPALFRYEQVSFLLMDDKVFAVMVTEEGAATREGIGIGQDLDVVDEVYGGLNCDEPTIGDFGGTLPYCAGKLRPGRHIWFGQDPIRSITLASTGFGR